VPTVTDHFEWNGLRFEVVDMDRSRIDKVLVTPSKEQQPQTAQQA
jgi:putative hemolysin